MSTASDPLGIGIPEGTRWGNVDDPSHPLNVERQGVRGTPTSLPGFKFEQPRVAIDWQKVANAPIKLIERTG